MFRSLVLLTGLLALLTFAASLGLSKENPPMTEVRYLGHRSYPSFTRLVFDTGVAGPDSFRVNYDEAGERVVFYPLQGTLAFTFAPVESVDALVREVDFVQTDEAKRGVAARLGPGAIGCKVSHLSDPARLVLDIYKDTKTSFFYPQGRPVKTIALDPGHGGRSNGSGKPGGLLEKDLALDLAVRLKRLLTGAGFRVILTRDKDEDVSPDERAGMANSAHADLYLSIHAAGSFGEAAGGTGVYTMDAGPLEAVSEPLAWRDQGAGYLPDSLGFARDLSESLGKLSDERPAVRQALLAGIGGLTMPAALVEIGSLADPKQTEALGDDAYRDKLALLLAEGINRYAKEVNR